MRSIPSSRKCAKSCCGATRKSCSTWLQPGEQLSQRWQRLLNRLTSSRDELRAFGKLEQRDIARLRADHHVGFKITMHIDGRHADFVSAQEHIDHVRRKGFPGWSILCFLHPGGRTLQ